MEDRYHKIVRGLTAAHIQLQKLQRTQLGGTSENDYMPRFSRNGFS